MNLYQYLWGSNPHYVVARDYSRAEATIKSKYGHEFSIERIENLGAYVLIDLEDWSIGVDQEEDSFPSPLGGRDPSPAD